MTKEILNEMAIKGNLVFRIKRIKVSGKENKLEMAVMPVYPDFMSEDLLFSEMISRLGFTGGLSLKGIQ